MQQVLIQVLTVLSAGLAAGGSNPRPSRAATDPAGPLPLPPSTLLQAPLFVHWNNRPWPTNMIVIDNSRYSRHNIRCRAASQRCSLDAWTRE